QHLVGPNRTDLGNKLLKTNRIKALGPAPQVAIGEQYVLRAFPGDDWEKASVLLLQKIYEDRDLDPILQVFLLKRVLAQVCAGSYPLTLSLARQREALDKAALDLTVPWMDPASDVARKTRAEARDLLRTIPPVEPALKSAAQQRQRIAAGI